MAGALGSVEHSYGRRDLLRAGGTKKAFLEQRARTYRVHHRIARPGAGGRWHVKGQTRAALFCR